MGINRRAAVRLLPGRPDHVGHRPAAAYTTPHRCRNRCGDEWEYLPLRNVYAYSAGDPSSRTRGCGNQQTVKDGHTYAHAPEIVSEVDGPCRWRACPGSLSLPTGYGPGSGEAAGTDAAGLHPHGPGWRGHHHGARLGVRPGHAEHAANAD